jgi:hypothetical protein
MDGSVWLPQPSTRLQQLLLTLGNLTF